MPESVKSRPTRSHEYLFLLAKNPRYYYDADAVREPHAAGSLYRWREGAKWEGERTRGYPSGSQHSMVPRQMCHPKGRNRRSVWTIATRPFKGEHFATYPPELVRPCILAGCPKDGIVLDPFMGAGTTGLVAKEEQRGFIGIELSPSYLDLARKRLGFR